MRIKTCDYCFGKMVWSVDGIDNFRESVMLSSPSSTTPHHPIICMYISHLGIYILLKNLRQPLEVSLLNISILEFFFLKRVDRFLLSLFLWYICNLKIWLPMSVGIHISSLLIKIPNSYGFAYPSKSQLQLWIRILMAWGFPCGVVISWYVQMHNLGSWFSVAPWERGHIHAWCVPIIGTSQKKKLGDFCLISGCCNSDSQALQDLSLKIQQFRKRAWVWDQE